MCDLASRMRLRIQGVVQGVGFRPFIYNLAGEYGIRGWVTNDSLGVLIEAEERVSVLEKFVQDIWRKAPPLAVIDYIKTEWISSIGDTEFVIRSSNRSERAKTLISPDVAVCPDCLAEMFDSEDRRYLYPFINCTNCGPRFTIINEMPYDRPFTSMGSFAMCRECKIEYDNPHNRRFHAQPNACPNCGPGVWLTDYQGQILEATDYPLNRSLPDWAQPVVHLRSKLHLGVIAGVKGLGGYHLLCDGKNPTAVKRLRDLKHRPDKPLALMMADMMTVKRYCEVSIEEEKLLTSPARPIVLLKWKNKGMDGIAMEVAPAEQRLGVMLPYTPLHYQLFDDQVELLIATSGNLHGEPIIYDDQEAISCLGGIVDYFLIHNRQIVRPCDDSVQRVDEVPIFLRRSRGYVPTPIRVQGMGGQRLLACGGESKNTFALSTGEQVFLSQHMGDLKTKRSLQLYRKMIDQMIDLFEINPEKIVLDLHPGYITRKFARDTFPEIESVEVQHHHAHIASCMAEHNLTGDVIGVAYDGTGYGTDGKIWGGEILIASPEQFQRFAHLKYISLPGGEQAILEPWRVGASYLEKICAEDWIYSLPLFEAGNLKQWQTLNQWVKRGISFPLSSSMGRLFDAVSAICGIRNQVSFEGQAAIELEEVAVGKLTEIVDVYPYSVDYAGTAEIIDPLPMLKRLAVDVYQGVRVREISQRFHRTIIEMTYQTVLRARETYNIERIVLGGGVFQNRLLCMGLCERLRKAGFEVYYPQLVSINDSGLALGQLYVADAQLKRKIW